MMLALDLNLILVLHTVLAERNVARAAARLHVTPSAVSNSLARLRDVFGDPLVTRKGRGVVPTPKAAEIAPAIARAIREIEGALLSAPFEPAIVATPAETSKRERRTICCANLEERFGRLQDYLAREQRTHGA
jgi:DNA-binding transcriptional LysR family regulator